MYAAKINDSQNASSKGPGKVPFFQAKLTVNQPNDVFEQEADTVAESVMRTDNPANNEGVFFKPATIVQRKCAHCEEEEKVQRKEDPVAGVRDSTQLGDYQYSHENDTGKGLIAHEFTHMMQNSSIDRKIQRAVSSHSHCTANANGSPADPMAAIQAANDRAILMSLGTSLLLFSESLFMRDPTFGPSNISAFYHRRLGDPASAPHGRFRNRFSGTLHNTLSLAQSSEMQSVSTRMERISHFLERNLNFRCAGTGSVTLGDCSSFHCGGGDILASCPSVNHGNDIAICPGFWPPGISAPDQQAVGIIHEVSHMMFRYGDHDTAPFAQSSAQRLSEPECYASLVADIYGIVPFDPSCPII